MPYRACHQWRQLPSEGIKRLSSASDVPLLVLDEGSVPCAKANPALSIKITQIHKTSSKGEENPLIAMLGSPGLPTALFPHLLPSTYMWCVPGTICSNLGFFFFFSFFENEERRLRSTSYGPDFSFGYICTAVRAASVARTTREPSTGASRGCKPDLHQATGTVTPLLLYPK